MVTLRQQNIIASDVYTCAISKSMIYYSQPQEVQTSQSIKKIQTWMGNAHALQLDIQKRNTKWKDAIDLEIEQIKEYQVFKDYGNLFMTRIKLEMLPRDTQYLLFLM